MDTRFRKSERLCSKDAIDKLFENAKSHRSGAFVLKYQKKENPDDNLPKVLISVPKRYVKLAVNRNYIKRLIREVYRLNKEKWQTGSDVESLAIIYNSSKRPSLRDVEEHLLNLFNRLK